MLQFAYTNGCLACEEEGDLEDTNEYLDSEPLLDAETDLCEMEGELGAERTGPYPFLLPLGC